MITVTSSTADIERQVWDESEKAGYWFIRSFGGQRAYDAAHGDLLRECATAHAPAVSRAVDYTSQATGNRWLSAEVAHWRPLHREAVSEIVSFAYYETHGSIGAFIPVKVVGSADGRIPPQPFVLLLTNHFFLRFRQRLGIELDGRDTVMRLLSLMPHMIINIPDDEEMAAGKRDVMLRLPVSVGFGKRRSDGAVCEIRTFLTDPELTARQRRLTRRLREYATGAAVTDGAPWASVYPRLGSEEAWKVYERLSTIMYHVTVELGLFPRLDIRLSSLIEDIIIATSRARTDGARYWRRRMLGDLSRHVFPAMGLTAAQSVALQLRLNQQLNLSGL